MAFLESYLQQMRQDFPTAWQGSDLSSLLNPNLVSSQVLGIKRSSLEKIAAFVASIYKLRSVPEYQKYILNSHSLFATPGFVHPKNHSVLMSFDFHLVNDEDPKLIEINTNASSSLIIHESYRMQKRENIFAVNATSFEKEILSCFENEYLLWAESRANQSQKLRTIAIVDENPPAQKLYIEFLLYQDVFLRAGYNCIITDPKELAIKNGRLVYQENLEIDLVYNRHTDFYFSTAACEALKEAYVKSYACFTPHPLEYALLADKNRLFEFSNSPKLLAMISAEEQALIQSVVLRSFDVKSYADKDWFWANKKTLFFKPKRSYGGKASYRGQGVTQTVFANILSQDYLAQEFAPPSEVEVTLEDGSKASFKYDLRFYVYNGRIQLGLARLWRGQMTNISSLGGGLAPIYIRPLG